MKVLRFACLPGCADCCRRQGYVYLTEQDIQRAAAFLNMSAADFEARYVFRTRNALRLRKPRDSQCHFFRDDGCAIHPAKPTQCRLFPFWPELLEDSRAWKRTAAWCPGIGRGRRISLETARRRSEQMRRAYPKMYED